MKQLLVLFTGGTIGSRKQGDGIDVNESGSYALIDSYNNSSQYRADVTLQAAQPLNLLSENLTPDDWLALAAAIRGADLSVYDAILITHGSDTLAYSASMISYLFAGTKAPIVLTASNYPLEEERSNGLRNFAGAIDFIAGASLPGVFVVYENDKREQLVYLGTRITQALSFTDQFGSPYDVPYGMMVNRQFEWHANAQNPRPEALKPSANPKLAWEPETLKLDDNIVYIKPYPGLNYSYYDFSVRKPKAVLHDLHHSGTACAIPEGPYSLPQFIARCLSLGVDVYICPIRDRTAALYSSSLRLIEAGAIVIENMSMEAAVAKLMLAYGMHDKKAEAIAFVTNTYLYYERIGG
ncbi:asparaginase domain-containing protein [Paenibacillus alkaliterrae]|uniref:asparaginase n=1 Tax=Paenibacillus alkaliterrae TaxID=320909 RepID=UPI001F384C4D|nr:asparaginase domain-containing protein [Paenibacillus alkaliterrae]MCF2938450.1 asparaginase domain-containing protein [Paenibacillus alkaliterrae]